MSREAMQLALEALDSDNQDIQLLASAVLRARLAAPAPEQTHPGYIIGSHWRETAYSRVCAGEAEADVLRDYGLVRVTDAEALRRDAERLKAEKEELRQRFADFAEEFSPGFARQIREDKT